MKKLFYKDPLVAAYMAREFRIIYRVTEGTAGQVRTVLAFEAVNVNPIEGGDKYCIHEDSLPIFEPRDCDLIDCKLLVGTSSISVEEKNGAFIYYEADGDFRETSDITEWKIIQRNNKPFFTPESEEK